MSPQTYSILYWTCGLVALFAYWSQPSKAKERTLWNVVNSIALTYLGLVLGLFIEGQDPGGMGIAYSVTVGLAGGSTVRSIAEARSPEAARLRAEKKEANDALVSTPPSSPKPTDD